MTINEYLRKAEQYLIDLEPLDKAAILSDIQKDFNELNLDTSANVSHHLGEVKQTIDKKRIARNYPPFNYTSPSSKIKKFFKYSFFTFLTLFIIGSSFLYWKFTPLFEVNDKEDRITILGGLIDINGKTGEIKFFDQYHIANYEETNFKHNFDVTITEENLKSELEMSFNTAAIQVHPSTNQSLEIKCKLASPTQNELLTQNDKRIFVNLNSIERTSCKVYLPENLKVSFTGKTSSLSLNKPQYDASIALEKGSVRMIPEENSLYKYDIEVDNGTAETPDSSKDESAYEIDIKIKKGSFNLDVDPRI